MMGIVLAVVAALSIITRVTRGAADDDDDEKPIVSTAARVSRDAAGQVVIAIGPATQRRIGLVAQTLAIVARPIQVEAYGLVLDPAPLSTLNRDLISAQAALGASAAQYRRSKRLYAERNNVSLRAMQAAEVAYMTDKARLEALERQLRDAWGGEIAQMDFRARSDLIDALIDRQAALARVSAPAGAAFAEPPRQAAIVVFGFENHPLSARAVYAAPTIDPRMQGPSFLLLMNTRGLPVRPGAAVSAALAASAGVSQGVIVPRSAVVRYAGGKWIYQALDGSRFVRREIVTAQATRAGYFVTRNVRSGMRVVVMGAQTLLSEELKAQIQPED